MSQNEIPADTDSMEFKTVDSIPIQYRFLYIDEYGFYTRCFTNYTTYFKATFTVSLIWNYFWKKWSYLTVIFCVSVKIKAISSMTSANRIVIRRINFKHVRNILNQDYKIKETKWKFFKATPKKITTKIDTSILTFLE